MQNQKSTLKCKQILHPKSPPAPQTPSSTPSSIPQASTNPNSNPSHPNNNTISSFLRNNVTSIIDALPSSNSSSCAWSCAWSSDGTLLASCHGAPDACIRLWKKTKIRRKRRTAASTATTPPSQSKHDIPIINTINNSSSSSTNQNTIQETNNEEYYEEEEEWKLLNTLRTDYTDITSARTIRSIAFAPTPSNVRYILAAASFDGTISIWEDFTYEDNQETDEIMNDGNNPTTSNGSSNPHSAGSWECTAQLEGHENEVKDVVWNSTGTLLASCGRDKSVWIWECFLPGLIGGDGTGAGSSSGIGGGEGDFECIAVLNGHAGDVKSLAFAPSHDQWGDGDEILLSASYDDTIKCWAEDAGDWYCALTLNNVHTSTIWSIATSPSGVRMVSGSADQSLAIWRCYTYSEKERRFPEDANLTAGRDGLWKCVGKLPKAHKREVYDVDCAPARVGHGRIASCGGDNCIHIYREVSVTSTTTMTSSSTVSSRSIAGGNGSSPDAPLFTTDASVSGAHDGDVNCIRWHPIDGTLLASVGDDGLVRIWNYDIV